MPKVYMSVFTRGDEEVKEGNSDVLLGLNRRGVVLVVEKASGKEGHNINVNERGIHLQVSLR